MSAKIRDVMTREVVTVQQNAPFKTIAELLTAHQIGAVPVIAPDGRPVGIVSQSDLLLKEDQPHAATQRPRLLSRLLESDRDRTERVKAGGRAASDVMSAPGVTIGPDATVAKAARLLHDSKVHHLPVVDEAGKLAGIVSRGDLVRMFVRTGESIREEILTDILVHHLWMDPRRIDVQVHEGLVTLRGQVESRSLVGILVRLVEELDGVVGVDQELSWDYDDTQPARYPTRDPLIGL